MSAGMPQTAQGSLVVWASVEPLASLGGIGTYQRALARCFAEAGAEMVFVEQLRDLPQIEGWRPPGRRIEAASQAVLEWRVRRLIGKALESRRPLVVVLGHLHLASLLSGAVRARARSCMLLYGSEAWRSPPGRHWLRSLRATRADLYVAVSPTTRERFLSWAKVAKERVIVAPPTVDAARACPSADQNPTTTGRVLMTLGRIPSSPRDKGHRDTLKALSTVVREVPEVEWWVVGDGDGRADLAREVHDRGLAERVRFFGVVDERRKHELLAEADLFVMPSRDEGFGIVLLEAVAHRLPVLARGGDGTRDALLAGDLGTLVGDSTDLAAELTRALRVPPSADELERRARLLEDHFGSARFDERARSVLRRLSEADSGAGG